MDGQASLNGLFPVKQAIIDESAAATATLVAAVTGKRIVVVSFFFTVSGAQDLQFQATGPVDLTGLMEFADSGGMVAHSPTGLFWTGRAEALLLDLANAVQVSGALTYIEVP